MVNFGPGFMRQLMGRFWLTRARAARSRGNIAAAVTAYGRAMRHGQAGDRAWGELQSLLGASQPNAEASPDLVAPPVPSRSMDTRSADRLRDGGQFSAAADAYQQILVHAPGRGDLWVQCGNMRKEAGDYVAAEAAYRQALTVMPADADAHAQLASVLRACGQHNAALASYRRAVSAAGGSAAATRELAAAGEPGAQLAAFEAQLRGRSPERLMQIASEVAALRHRLDRLAADLPEPAGWAAFPIAAYGLFRDVFDLPAPPPGGSKSARIKVIVRADAEPLDTLHLQLAAMRQQSHQDWQLVMVGTDRDRAALVTRAASDARICWAKTEEIGGPADWVMPLQAGAIPHRHALGWISYAASLGPAELFVCDAAYAQIAEDRMSYQSVELGQVVDTDMLRQSNIWGETAAVRADLLAAGETFVQIAARKRAAHIPLPLVWRDAGQHKQPVVPPRPPLPRGGTARIAVIIPTRDNIEDASVMAESLRQRAEQPALLEITVIDNGSIGDRAVVELARLAAQERVTVVQDGTAFNWSRLNNAAVARTDAEIVLFANDDMRMLTPGWDDALRAMLARPEVGAVGVKLLYEDNTIQHAGMLLGWKGGTIHDGLYEPADAPGPGMRWQLTREVGAVTGAFLATRREVFLAMGGFDAAELPISFSDVDYALKLRDAGLKVLWTPDITLYHHESKTRGLDHLDPARMARNAAELAVMRQRWGAAMDFDPSVNPYWHDATLPFRMISAPSVAKIERYIRAGASGTPWKPIK